MMVVADVALSNSHWWVTLMKVLRRLPMTVVAVSSSRRWLSKLVDNDSVCQWWSLVVVIDDGCQWWSLVVVANCRCEYSCRWWLSLVMVSGGCHWCWGTFVTTAGDVGSSHLGWAMVVVVDVACQW